MSRHSVYVYQWAHETKKEYSSFIRAYGINSQGQNVCLNIQDFKRYVYVELLPPTAKDHNMVMKKVISLASSKYGIAELVQARHLFFMSETKGTFLKVKFSSWSYLSSFVYLLRCESSIQARYKVHEDHANPVLQLICNHHLEMVGWVTFVGKEITDPVVKKTRAAKEYIVSSKNLKASASKDEVVPYVMSFDFEVYSQNEEAMPSNKPRDYIFQISCVFNKPCKAYKATRLLLTLPSCDKIENATVVTCESEKVLLITFLRLIKEEQPNVLLGYNILGFDIPYLIQRCERYMLLEELKLIGLSLSLAKQQEIKWSSNAFRNQHFKFIDWEGILLMDLLPIIQRDYKLDSYKLEAVGQEFVGSGKDPVTYRDIFKAFRTKEMTEVGKYCIKDSELVLQLYNKIHIWIAYTEMAKVCNVSVFDLYTQGQQNKIYAQVYKYCSANNIVVTSQGYVAGEGENYRGAHVIQPEPGYYEDVIPLDFSSLYPSIIQAYNICFSSAVIDPEVPDDLCNVFEWEDHQRCEHDPKVIQHKDLTAKIKDIEVKQKSLRTLRGAIKNANAADKLNLYQDLMNKEAVQLHREKVHVANLKEAQQQALQDYKVASAKVSELVQSLPDSDENLEYPEDLTKALEEEKASEDRLHNVTVNFPDDLPNTKDQKKLVKVALRNKVHDYKVNNLKRQINLLDAQCKPLRAQRAELSLTSSKVNMCSKRHYRFYKEEVQKGIIPLIISNLLQSRKDIRKKISALEVNENLTEHDEFLIKVYNKQQLAMKVAANSMYGGMGMGSGLLAYMPAAMCVTMKGREALNKAVQVLQDQHKVHLVYGDTDSTYIRFPWITDMAELWDHSIKVAQEVSSYFPPPMKLEFEMKIYRKFLILSKKRYMWQSCERDGKLNPKVGTKGVLLSRRDNSGFLKQVYHDVTQLIFNKAGKDQVTDYLLGQINNLYRGLTPTEQFVITKSVGEFQADVNLETQTLGSYKVKQLPNDPSERQTKLNGRSEREFYIQSCPAQVRLAERMRLRGFPVEANTRLQYVVLDKLMARTVGDMIEDLEYYLEHKGQLKINHHYYLRSLSNPLNQLLKVGLSHDKFLDKEEGYRVNHTKMLNQIKQLNSPIIKVKE